MKKLSLIVIVALVGAMCFFSCEKKNGGSSQTGLTLEMEVSDFNSEGFALSFKPGEQCASIEYAIVASVDARDAYVKFENGTFDKADILNSLPSEVFFPQDSIGPFTVFARPVSGKGDKGGIVIAHATASPAGLLMSGYDDILVDLKVAISDTDNYDKVGALVVSKEVFSEIGMSVDELAKMYYDAGMISVYSGDEEFKLALNGLPDQPYYIVIVVAGKDGTLAEVFQYTLVSPPTDPSLALPEAADIEVMEIEETTARLIYKMGKNTRCYYQAAITVDGYEELLANAPESYENPEDYAREYIAFYSTVMYTDDDWVWPDFIPGTEYIALSYPMNANGILGYGPKTAVNFMMKGTPPADAAPACRDVELIFPVPGANKVACPIVSVEQEKAVM